MNTKRKLLRVLVISHNVFSSSGNMGKTMMHMLAGIPANNVAQIYFHQEIPTRNAAFVISESRTVMFCARYLLAEHITAHFQVVISMNLHLRAEQTRVIWPRSISFPDGVPL